MQNTFYGGGKWYKRDSRPSIPRSVFAALQVGKNISSLKYCNIV